METIEDMVKYIFQIIDKIEMNSIVLKNFLDSNSISYSSNKNGIFINISLLSDEMIVKFYKLIRDNYNESIENDKYEEEYGLYLSNLKISDKIKTKNQKDTHTISYKELILSEVQVKLLNLI